MALVVICAGIGFGEYALFTHVIRPANLGIGAIGSQWMMYGDALTYLLHPHCAPALARPALAEHATNPALCR